MVRSTDARMLLLDSQCQTLDRRACGVSRGIWLFLLASSACCAIAQAAVEAPRPIRVVFDNAYAPYSFLSDDGKLQGILVDQWQAWESKTGIKVEFDARDWGEAIQRMRAGEFDVIDEIVETVERRTYFDFTAPYATVETSIFFRADISGIADLASLRGFPVGVKKGDQHIDRLKENGVTTVIPFQNTGETVEAARQHKIDVFVADAPSALYLLHKAGIADEFRQSAPIFHDELRRAVRKGDAATLHSVSAGFAAVDSDELKRIDEKWFGSPINKYGRYIKYAGYAAVAAALLIAGLAGWNRTLNKRILQRTAALSKSEQAALQLAQEIRLLSEQREDHLRFVIDTIPTMVWSLLPDGTLDFTNQRWMEYTGLSQREAIEKPTAIVHPEDLPRVVEKWLVNVAAAEPTEDEMRLRNAEGEYRWFLVRTVPLRNEQGSIVKWYGTSSDIEDFKRARDQLQALSRGLVELQESERKELARELHDRIGQNLTALGINLEILRSQSTGGEFDLFRPRLQDSAALVESTADAIENLMSELRPPMLDDYGLLPALDWYAKQFAQRTGIDIAVRSGETTERAVPAAETALFRIAQEALNNVAKHARATHVDIVLEQSATACTISIEDNGAGFDSTSYSRERPMSGLGMVTMRERTQAAGGDFEVQTVTGRGTRVVVRIPR